MALPKSDGVLTAFDYAGQKYSAEPTAYSELPFLSEVHLFATDSGALIAVGDQRDIDREHRGRWVAVYRSADLGLRWDQVGLFPGFIPNDRGFSYVTKQGGIALFVLASSDEPDSFFALRWHRIARSSDDGLTWELGDRYLQHSTLFRAANGHLWFLGVFTNSLYARRPYLSVDDGQTWSFRPVIDDANIDTFSFWSYFSLPLSDGTIFGASGGQSYASLYRVTRNGTRFEPIGQFGHGSGFVAVRGIVPFSATTIVVALQSFDRSTRSFLWRTTDGGETWSPGGLQLGLANGVQRLEQLEDGSLLVIVKGNRGFDSYRSTDQGLTWNHEHDWPSAATWVSGFGAPDDRFYALASVGVRTDFFSAISSGREWLVRPDPLAFAASVTGLELSPIAAVPAFAPREVPPGSSYGVLFSPVESVIRFSVELISHDWRYGMPGFLYVLLSSCCEVYCSFVSHDDRCEQARFALTDALRPSGLIAVKHQSEHLEQTIRSVKGGFRVSMQAGSPVRFDFELHGVSDASASVPGDAIQYQEDPQPVVFVASNVQEISIAGETNLSLQAFEFSSNHSFVFDDLPGCIEPEVHVVDRSGTGFFAFDANSMGSVDFASLAAQGSTFPVSIALHGPSGRSIKLSFSASVSASPELQERDGALVVTVPYSVSFTAPVFLDFLAPRI